MTDFIQGTKSNNQWQTDYYRQNSNKNTQSPIKTQTTKPDTFDKKDKEEKLIFNCFGAGQLAKAGSIIGCAIITGIAFVKRKKIGEFITNLINSKKKPNVDIPKPLKTAKPKVPNIEPPKPIVTKIPMTADSLKEEFGKIKKDDIPQFVSSVKKGTREEQKSLLSMFTELDKKHSSMADDLPEKLPLGQKLYVLEKQMKEQNLSFIPKLEITSDDSEKVIADKINRITSTMGFNKNEATLLEGLDWLEKYGQYGKDLNFSPYKNVYSTILDDITIPIRHDGDDIAITDKVLNRYIDIYNKFAKKWESNDYIHSDASNLTAIFEEHAGKMSKETAFRFLESMEKTAAIKNDAYTLKLYADYLKIDKTAMEEFVKRAEALDDKLPKYRKISANK